MHCGMCSAQGRYPVPNVPDIHDTTPTTITDKMTGGTDYIQSIDAGLKRLE